MPNPNADFPSAVHTPVDTSVFSNKKLGLTSPKHTEVEGKQEQEIVAIQTKIGHGSSVPGVGKYLRGAADGSSSWETPPFTLLDEDDFASDSDVQAATQQSIKAYILAQIVAAEVGFDSKYLQIVNDLSDLADIATARANLGLGALAVLDSLAHGDLTGIGASDHHARYTDGEAVAALATADVYVQIIGDTMTGNLDVPIITANTRIITQEWRHSATTGIKILSAVAFGRDSLTTEATSGTNTDLRVTFTPKGTGDVDLLHTATTGNFGSSGSPWTNAYINKLNLTNTAASWDDITTVNENFTLQSTYVGGNAQVYMNFAAPAGKNFRLALYADGEGGTWSPWIDFLVESAGIALRTEGYFDLMTSNAVGVAPDYDDHIRFQTTSNVPEITTIGSCDLKINAGGSNDLLLNDGGGNVGIGTSSPDSAFHIKANFPGQVGNNYAGQLIIQNPADSVFSNVVITAYESDGDGNPDQQLWYLGSSSINNSDITFLNRRNAKLTLGTSGTSRITILGNGNVGIGVAAPDHKLQVDGNIVSNTDSTDDLGSSSKFWANTYTDNLYISTEMFIHGSANYLYIRDSDDVNKDFGFTPKYSEMTFGATAGFTIALGGNNLCKFAWNALYPSTDSAKGLGLSTNYWKETYTDKLYLNSTATLDGAVAGQITVTGNVEPDGHNTRRMGDSDKSWDHCYFRINYSYENGDLIGYIGEVSSQYRIYTGGTLVIFANPVEVRGTIHSDMDSADDLGTSSKYWANTYTDKLFLNSTATLDGSVVGKITSNAEIRTSTSLYRRYYHLPLASFDPGLSGATWTVATANNLCGWQLNAVGETLEFQSDIHADWDGISDLEVTINFQLLDAGSADDTVDLKLICYYMGAGDTAIKTQTVEVATTTDGTQYKMYVASFAINYDETDNVIDIGDNMCFVLNLETDTSEIDNVLIVDGKVSYKTTHLGIESGDV